MMADWPKRVNKERGGDLLPDEELVDACFFQGRGSLDAMIAFAGRRFGPNPGDKVDSQLTAEAQQFAEAAKQAEMSQNHAPEGSMGSKIPDDKGVIAVTTRRVIFFAYKQGTFKTKIEDPTLAVSREDVRSWEYTSGKATSELALGFSDGSHMVIELPRLNKPDDFAAKVGIPTSA